MLDSRSAVLQPYIACAIALSLFVVGRFGLTDILGIKRVAELLLLLPLGCVGWTLAINNPRIWLNAYFLMPLSFFICQLFWLPDFLILADCAFATAITGIIVMFGPLFAERVTHYIINITTFLALLGLLEFFLLLIDPSLKEHVLLFYDDYSGSTIPVINHSMQILGLADGTSYHLWGMAITRLRSFASEPSLLVGYFLIPSALALTYQKHFRIRGIICLSFCLCSLAGSVFAACGFSGLTFFIAFFRRRLLILLFPIVIYGIFIWILNYHFTELIYTAHNSTGGYDFLDKTNSANVRFSYIRNMMGTIMISPLGINEEIKQPLGLILGGMARGGVLGFILISTILWRQMASITYLLAEVQINFWQRSGLCLIFGSLIAGILYLDNCFVQIYGFTIMILIYYRLQVMTKKI